MITGLKTKQPGWPEILAGLVTFALLLFAFALGFAQLPVDRPVLQGVVGSTAGGFAGVGAFFVAYGLRIRTLPAFGFRRVSSRWLVIGIAAKPKSASPDRSAAKISGTPA